MYYDLIKFPIRHENLKWEAREELLDIKGIPHLFLMVKLTGTKFPQRDQIARVWAGDVQAKYVMMDNDSRTVRAYFDEPLREGSQIYFGLTNKPELEFDRFSPSKVKKLDRSRLSGKVIIPKHLK
jgi:hypothetical protein